MYSAEKSIPDNFVNLSLTLPLLLGNSELIDEELEIAVPPPIDMAKWIQLRKNLLYTLNLTILYTAGSWRTGALIVVGMNQKTPLLNMLTQITEAEKAESRFGNKWAVGDYYWDFALPQNSSSHQRRRIYLTLKEEDSTYLPQVLPAP